MCNEFVEKKIKKQNVIIHVVFYSHISKKWIMYCNIVIK